MSKPFATQAIVTRYLGPTNYKGARIKATCARGSVVISYPHELNQDERHDFAASALVAKFVKEDAAKYGTHKNPWSAKRVMGVIPSGEYVHVLV